jgi:hypothetical protein
MKIVFFNHLRRCDGDHRPQWQDVAAYYAFLPHLTAAPSNAAPDIVASGAPMRTIPPCAARHGGLEVKAGSPWLQGASANYLKAQRRPSPTERGTTTSASRCALSRGA